MNLAEIKLSLGHDTTVADGTYIGLATWSTQARDYKDVPGLYATESDARKNGGDAVGTRLVRWTVFRGSVTTRRGLR